MYNAYNDNNHFNHCHDNYNNASMTISVYILPFIV